MKSDLLWLAHVQFLASLSFLAVFAGLALALAWGLFFFKLRARGPARTAWVAAYRFWVRIYALAFVLALASSLPALAELGALWPGLMSTIGNVAGPMIGYAVLGVFLFKSCFLGVMLFGQHRVSDRVHTLAVFMVAIGQTAAVFWVVALYSWMKTPAGADFVNEQFQVQSWAAVIFNRSLVWHLAQVLLGAFQACAFFMLGVTALQALRRPLEEGERLVFRVAAIVALVVGLGQIALLDGTMRAIARQEPAKAAALVGYRHSGAPPALILFGLPDAADAKDEGGWRLRGDGGRWLGRNADGSLQGLDSFGDATPPVAPVFWSARVAALLSAWMLAIAALTILRLRLWRASGHPFATISTGWLRLLTLSMFAGCLAVVAGVWVSVVGSQPFLVTGFVRDTGAVLRVSRLELTAGALGMTTLYVLLFAAFVGMLLHAVRYGVVPVRKGGRRWT